jgi:hypothetical protein
MIIIISYPNNTYLATINEFIYKKLIEINNINGILSFYRCILSYFKTSDSQKITKRVLFTIKIDK